AVQASLADDCQNSRGGAVVGGVDHRVEQATGGVVEATLLMSQHSQVARQQHRLDAACGVEALVEMDAAEAPMAVDHRERLAAVAARQGARSAVDRGGAWCPR